MIITQYDLTKIIDEKLQLAEIKRIIYEFIGRYGAHRFRIAMTNADKKECALYLYYDVYSSNWELSHYSIPFCSRAFDAERLTDCFYYDGFYYWYLNKDNKILCIKA